MIGLVIIPIVFLIFYLLSKYKSKIKIDSEKDKPPPINPSAPGVHYYEECDYGGEHKHTDEAPSNIFLRGPTTIKCTPFKSMEITN
jgi:hypothetical protein